MLKKVPSLKIKIKLRILAEKLSKKLFISIFNKKIDLSAKNITCFLKINDQVENIEIMKDKVSQAEVHN